MENMPAPRMAASPVAVASNRLSWGLRDDLPKKILTNKIREIKKLNRLYIETTEN